MVPVWWFLEDVVGKGCSMMFLSWTWMPNSLLGRKFLAELPLYLDHGIALAP
jgi:hypothetical protein